MRLVYFILGIALTITVFSFMALNKEIKRAQDNRNLAVTASYVSCVVTSRHYKVDLYNSMVYCNTVANWANEAMLDDQ